MTPLGWLLFALSTSVKALLVLTAAFALTRLMRNRSASERHLVWMLASICVLALPVFALAGPQWRLRGPALWPETSLQVTPEPAVAPAAVRVTAPPSPPRSERNARALGAPAPATNAPPAPARSIAPSAVARGGVGVVQPAAVPRPPRPDRSVAPLFILLVWLGGTALVLARLVASMIRVHMMSRAARPLLDPALLVRAHGIAADIGLTRPMRMVEGDDDAMPITFGILRATLLLPSSAQEWPGSRQNAVLRHELAHVRRRDSLSQLIVELGCALYWFNPLMWYASRRMCAEREHACDDAVLSSGSRASDYAAELLDIARTLRTQRAPAIAAIAMARQSHLRARVASLLDARVRRDRTSPKLFVPAWIGAFLLVTPLSSLTMEFGGRLGPTPRDASPASAETRNSPAPRAWEKPQHAARAGAPASLPPVASSSAQSREPGASLTAPPAAAAAASLAGVLSAALQEDCLSGGRKTSISSNSNDDRHTIKWSGNDCSGEVLVEGDVQFNADFTMITGVSRGGQVRITTEEGRTERRVTIRPENGSVAYDYRLNGDRRELDAAGQQWLSSTLLFLFRRMGFMAEERAAAILQRGGANALLAEVELLGSDHARASYLSVLIARGQLDEAALQRVLTLAGRKIQSDHYRTQTITAVAGRYNFTEGVRSAYIDAVSGMSSDHYRHQAFSTLLKKGELTPTQISGVLAESRRIGSDHYRAQLLDELASSYRSSPAIRAAYLEAAGGIDSDHYKSNVLMRLFTMGGMSNADLARVVDAAATIDSDHYRAQVLDRVARHDLSDATLQRSFIRAASSIDSDHYLQGVLARVASRDALDTATLMALLESAGEIDSDHYRSMLLIDIARKHRLQGEARTRFERLMKEMGSDTYRGRVASALLSN